MEHPKTYLLKNIVNHEKSGYKSFGTLHAKHFDDVALIMTNFAEETALEVIKRLNNGEQIEIVGQVFQIKK